MNGNTMYELTEEYFWNIMEDFAWIKGWSELPSEQMAEEISKTKEWQEYAMGWVNSNV